MSIGNIIVYKTYSCAFFLLQNVPSKLKHFLSKEYLFEPQISQEILHIARHGDTALNHPAPPNRHVVWQIRTP